MRSKTLLLVEDNPDNIEIALRALHRCSGNTEIIVTRDGVEATEYLFGTGKHAGRDVSVMPDLILLDINMPRMNGFEVLKRVRGTKMTAHIPVIILSASSEQSDIEKSCTLGANCYLQKSAAFAEFREKMTELVGRWLVCDPAV